VALRGVDTHVSKGSPDSAPATKATGGAEHTPSRGDAEDARYARLFSQLRHELFGVSQRFSADVARRILRGHRGANARKGRSLWVTLLTEATNAVTGALQRKTMPHAKSAELPEANARKGNR
jgi:hypothetical protein